MLRGFSAQVLLFYPDGKRSSSSEAHMQPPQRPQMPMPGPPNAMPGPPQNGPGQHQGGMPGMPPANGDQDEGGHNPQRGEGGDGMFGAVPMLPAHHVSSHLLHQVPALGNETTEAIGEIN
eukprot:scaffold361194_cov49-Prasinocladus_malaysianus.AAC.1